ncbi:metallophosphoesterase [bacterium]|nr:metallophosphoesterase [bacterium]
MNNKLALITVLILLSIPLHALRFGILADTRCGELPSSGWNETGVNTGAVNAIAKEMLENNVDLVLAGGDLIHGQFVPFDFIPLTNMYEAWINAMAPIYNAGIPVFPIPGNHEYYYGTVRVHTNIAAAGPLPMTCWSNYFGCLPKNGVSNRIGRSYSFSFSNAFFIGLDNYEVDDDLSYLLDTNFTYQIQNQWVREQLNSNSLRHIFVFSHFPAVTLVEDYFDLCGGGSLGKGGLAERQAFWDGLADAGCRVFFGAHQHFYARATASIYNGPAMQHVIIGNSGAPYEDWDGQYYENGHNGVKIVPEYHEGNEKTFGFVLVDVEDLTVTVTYKSSVDLITWTNRDSFSYTLIPAPPEILAPSAINSNEFTANWRPSAGAEFYLLDVSVSNSFSSFVGNYHNLAAPDTTHSVTGLFTGNRYYYRLRAADVGGTGDYSMTATVLTEQGVPHALPASDNSTNSFAANWLSATGATNYLLYVASDFGFSNLLPGYNPLNTGITSSFSVLGLNSGTEYFYRLKAQNEGGITTNSHTITAWTIPLSPVTILASNITETSFFANWDPAHGTTNYFLDVSLANTFSNFVIGNLNVGVETSHLVDNLDNTYKYYYRIRASNAGGTGANSDTMEVVLVPEPIRIWIMTVLSTLLIKRNTLLR